MMKIETLIFGTDPTAGIVHVQANYDGQVTIWRRVPSASLRAGFGQMVVEREQFNHWVITSDRSLLDAAPNHNLKELDGEFPLRWLVETQHYRRMENAIVRSYNRKHHDNKKSFFDLSRNQIFYYPSPVEQYLVQSGRTYFKGLQWSDLHRLQFDLETTDLSWERGEIFLIAITDNRGYSRILDNHEMSEAQMIAFLVNIIQARDPDIIENHNIFAFDLPFLQHRAKKHGIPLQLGRDGSLLYRGRSDGTLKVGGQTERYPRFHCPGRELIDTLHAVKRWNAITRELSGHGLKEAAQHFGVAQQGREYIKGDEVARTWKTNPEKVRRYAYDDVQEVTGLSDLLMGTSFALAQMLPIPFERIATAGTATSIDTLFVRAYLDANHSVPVPMKKQGTFKGGMTELIRQGVIANVVKADAESLYPSIMLTYSIKPESDTLDIFLPILKHITTERLTAKARLKMLSHGSTEYNFTNAYQGALKSLINSFFGYLGSDEFVTFNDPKAADEVTQYGRDILAQMRRVIEALGGKPIELDTDGIYFSIADGGLLQIADWKKNNPTSDIRHPTSMDPVAFVETINEKLNRPGITIGFDGHWQAMFSIGKKNYALLSHDGKLTTKGAGLKASDLEPFLATFLKEGMADLLHGDIEGLRSRFRSIVSALRNRELTAGDVSKSTRLSQEISEYQQSHHATLPHYEAAIAAGLMQLRAGETVTYYKAESGWKLTTSDARDYDVSHYLKRLKETTLRFQEAFTATDFRELFKIEDDLFSAIQRTIKPVQRVLLAGEKPWIELAHGFKLNKDNPTSRVTRIWVVADDTEAISAFKEKFDGVDIHRSQLAVLCPTPPTGKHSEYQRIGDFVLEIDGSRTDPDTMRAALSIAHRVLNLIREKLGDHAPIEAFFNGGKSIYLFVRGLDPSPVYRLHEKHRLLAQAITKALPDDMKPFIDLELYDPDQMLRLEGTRYPGGGYNVPIPLSLIESEDWEAIKRMSEEGGRGVSEERQSVTPRSPAHPLTHSPSFYATITKDVHDEPVKKHSTARRKLKATQHAEKVLESQGIVDPDDFPIPCVKALGEAIARLESIGFNGRNKLISELTIRGRAQGESDREIENQIVSVFLSNGDPHRYGVLEDDHRPDPNPSGFQLRDDFSIERLNPFDVSCSKCAQWCDVENCYRSKEFLPLEQESPSYDDYRSQAQGELHAILTEKETLTRPGLIAVDAGLGSGKSFSAMRKALELAHDANVAIFVPTHAAGSDLINQIPKTGVILSPEAVVTHVYGKREETCLPEKWERQTTCTQCPIHKQFFKSASTDNEKEILSARQAKARRIKIISECKGKVMDLSQLLQQAAGHGACASVISKILAHAETWVECEAYRDHQGNGETTHHVLAVLPHHYLIDARYQTFINKIDPAYVFVDEGDMIAELLLSNHQATLTIAETRSRLDGPYTKACNFRCDQCHVHFADTFGNRIDVRRKLLSSKEYEHVSQPSHFILFLTESVEEVKQLVSRGDIEDGLFDFDAIAVNIKRLEAALNVVHKGDLTPIRYFDAIQRTLENASIDGVTQDKLSEGLTVTEINASGETEEKEIRPPVIVATIAVFPCTTPAFGRRFIDNDLEIVPDEPTAQPLNLKTLCPDRQHREGLRETDHEMALMTVLEFVNFCDRSGGKIGMYCELRSERSDAVNEAVEDEDPLETPQPASKRGGIKSCAIRLRYLDVDGYKQVVHFLASRQTVMLSGTFLDHQLTAESLLLSPDEIDYRDARLPLHENVLIIHHNPQFGKLAPDGISLATFGNSHLAELVRRIVFRRNGTKILTFEVNARQGNVLYNGLSKDMNNTSLWVQNECNLRLMIPDWCSPEVTKERFDNWLFIDKLRSATARAVNRATFDVAIVHGNGYFDWYDYLPFVHAIQQTVNPDADLDTHIEYNRQRAVLQALLRTPRDKRRTVCLYLSGDMSHLDYPDDLKGRVVTTNRLLKALRDKSPDRFICNRENQIELLARVIAGFIDGTVTRDDIDAAIDDFDFSGKYTGGKHEARKETVDLSGLSQTHQYLVQLWIEVHKESSDHAFIMKTAIERLKHVDKCIEEKGYVDMIQDRKGKKQDWRQWIDFLVDKAYLKPEKQKGLGKKPKTVYVRPPNGANPHGD